ncbi:hypothetical protein K443DRAFT_102442, partial [Laccaria amethystina LaAM-08-1]
CSLQGQKKREPRISAFWRYFAFSGLVGRYLKGQKRREVRVPVFKRYSTFSSLLQGEKKMRGVRSRVPEIFCIFCFGR